MKRRAEETAVFVNSKSVTIVEDVVSGQPSSDRNDASMSA